MGSPEPSLKRQRKTALRHLLLGLVILLAFFFTAALCSLPR